jgi:diguanylate cyclase (GGDEF)-like protein
METVPASLVHGPSVNASYLVDPQGRIVASDFAAKWPDGDHPAAGGHLQEIVGDVGAEALAQLAQGQGDFVLPCRIHAGASEQPTLGHLHVRRFVGEAGVLALVTVRSDEPDPIHDALTGLPDRRALAIRRASWQTAGGDQVRCAVLFVDLNQFKEVNDAHGHAAGDEVLVIVGQRLAQCVREGDLVVRYGGDEFVLLLKDIGSAQDAWPVIERIHRCVQEPIQLGGHKLQVTAAVGLAIIERRDMTIEAAIAAADRDMYASKRRPPK